MAESIGNGRKIAASLINYAVPVACVAFLVCVVADKASADYGVIQEERCSFYSGGGKICNKRTHVDHSRFEAYIFLVMCCCR